MHEQTASPMPTRGASTTAPRRLLNLKQLGEKLGVSERTVHKIIGEPWMPHRIELAPRVFRWDEAEVDEALAARAPRRSRPADEPTQLLRGKVEKLKREGVPA